MSSRAKSCSSGTTGAANLFSRDQRGNISNGKSEYSFSFAVFWLLIRRTCLNNSRHVNSLSLAFVSLESVYVWFTPQLHESHEDIPLEQLSRLERQERKSWKHDQSHARYAIRWALQQQSNEPHTLSNDQPQSRALHRWCLWQASVKVYYGSLYILTMGWKSAEIVSIGPVKRISIFSRFFSLTKDIIVALLLVLGCPHLQKWT